jgi:hypothetical protein
MENISQFIATYSEWIAIGIVAIAVFFTLRRYVRKGKGKKDCCPKDCSLSEEVKKIKKSPNSKH